MAREMKSLVVVNEQGIEVCTVILKEDDVGGEVTVELNGVLAFEANFDKTHSLNIIADNVVADIEYQLGDRVIIPELLPENIVGFIDRIEERSYGQWFHVIVPKGGGKSFHLDLDASEIQPYFSGRVDDD